MPATPTGATHKAATPGGQPGNANRVTHGLRSRQPFRLVLGKLPKAMARVEIDAQHFRRALEQATLDRHGEIDLPKSGLIATAAAWQRHSALCVRWLREHEAKMTHAERLSYSREIATASANRDKAVAALRLERTAQDALDALYSSPVAATRDVAPSSASTAIPPADACNSVLEAYNGDTPSPPQED